MKVRLFASGERSEQEWVAIPHKGDHVETSDGVDIGVVQSVNWRIDDPVPTVVVRRG